MGQIMKFDKIDFTDERWDGVSIEAQDLVENLISKRSTRRATIRDILNHSWVQNDSLC